MRSSRLRRIAAGPGLEPAAAQSYRVRAGFAGRPVLSFSTTSFLLQTGPRPPALLLRRGEVDEPELRVQYRVFLVPQNPRLHQHVAIATDSEAPGGVDLDDPRHLAVQPVAFGARRQPDRLLVEAVVFLNRRAGIVALVDVLAEQELHEVVGVGLVGDPRGRAHLQLALLLELQELGELVL